MRLPIFVVVGLGALLLAGFSAAVQRHGPDQAIFCALGKSKEGFDIYCPKPVLNAGWPAPYLFDRPGISVENRIGIPEDDFRFWPFTANIAFYWLLLAGIRRISGRPRLRGGDG
ncbi:hypothetical protein [Novosphingobium sp. Chol11]|uniref:hypothetical protein n=1 Tax=Novosphingobium sp. Chol11 TaxID=1385763 RepID=UPI000BE2EFA1|nr:hypothetical protein [Novosphingobium sp. Chol11]